MENAVLRGRARHHLVVGHAVLIGPHSHEQIWAVQEGPDFPGTMYGISRDTLAPVRMARQANWFSAHRDDQRLDG
jgi:gamma-carbonic anhydrase